MVTTQDYALSYLVVIKQDAAIFEFESLLTLFLQKLFFFFSPRFLLSLTLCDDGFFRHKVRLYSLGN